MNTIPKGAPFTLKHPPVLSSIRLSDHQTLSAAIEAGTSGIVRRTATGKTTSREVVVHLLSLPGTHTRPTFAIGTKDFNKVGYTDPHLLQKNGFQSTVTGRRMSGGVTPNTSDKDLNIEIENLTDDQKITAKQFAQILYNLLSLNGGSGVGKIEHTSPTEPDQFGNREVGKVSQIKVFDGRGKETGATITVEPKIKLITNEPPNNNDSPQNISFYMVTEPGTMFNYNFDPQ